MDPGERLPASLLTLRRAEPPGWLGVAVEVRDATPGAELSFDNHD